MEHRYWPLFDLRIDSPDLTLRPMTEADQPAIADLLPDVRPGAQLEGCSRTPRGHADGGMAEILPPG